MSEWCAVEDVDFVVGDKIGVEGEAEESAFVVVWVQGDEFVSEVEEESFLGAVGVEAGDGAVLVDDEQVSGAGVGLEAEGVGEACGEEGEAYGVLCDAGLVDAAGGGDEGGEEAGEDAGERKEGFHGRKEVGESFMIVVVKWWRNSDDFVFIGGVVRL